MIELDFPFDSFLTLLLRAVSSLGLRAGSLEERIDVCVGVCCLVGPPSSDLWRWLKVRRVRKRGKTQLESHLIPSSELIHAWLGRSRSLEWVWLLGKWIFSRRSSCCPGCSSSFLVVHETVQVDEGRVFA